MYNREELKRDYLENFQLRYLINKMVNNYCDQLCVVRPHVGILTIYIIIPTYSLSGCLTKKNHKNNYTRK